MSFAKFAGPPGKADLLHSLNYSNVYKRHRRCLTARPDASCNTQSRINAIANAATRCVQIFARGQSSNAGGIIKLLCRQSLGGPATGIAFGLCTSLWLYGLPYEANSASTNLLVAAYASYFVSEDIFQASGILATVALGMSLCITTFKVKEVSVTDDAKHIW